jgi:hypothetical protein
MGVKNKYIIFLWLIVTTLVACGAIQRTGQNETLPAPAPTDKPDQADDEDDDSNRPISILKPRTKTVVFHGERYKVRPGKTEFNGVVMLPFSSLNQTPNSDLLSRIMFSYLSGVEHAAKQLESQGLKLKLKILDSKNHRDVVAKLLKTESVENADFIIGPIIGSQLALVNEYSEKKGIPVFSPFSQLDTMQLTNGLFFNFKTPEAHRARQLAEFWETRFTGERPVIYTETNQKDESFILHLRRELQERNIDYDLKPFSRYTNWTEILSETNHQPVYIASGDKNVISVSLGGIYASKRPVSVFLNETVLDDENNEYKFWNELDVHVMAERFVNYHTYPSTAYRIDYRKAHGMDPDKYGIMGFDQFSFLGECLLTFGAVFPEFITNKTFKYSNSRYHFRPHGNVYQNMGIQFYRFTDFKLERVE